ncbi:MAG: peptidoglycan DD-metalloendopeptidase family protein [Bacteroidota bacterium]|nr:peptidoglycan DD-metalloendopeptidase family protein [Bacteroidota bacterium]
MIKYFKNNFINGLNIKALLIVTCFLSINLLKGYAQDKKVLEKNKKQIEKDIQLTNLLLSETKKNKQASLTQLMLLNTQINQREDLINTTLKEISLLDKQIRQNTEIIGSLEINLKNLKEEYAKTICNVYRTRNSYNRLMFIFAAKDFNQAYKRLKYLQEYSSYRKRQAEMIVSTEKNISNKIEEIKAKKAGKEILKEKNEEEKSILATEKDQKNSMVKELQHKESELKKTIKEKEKAARNLQKEIEKIIAAEIARAAAASKVKKTNNTTATNTKTNKTPVKYELTPEEILASGSFAKNKGKLPWPSEHGIITSSFGEHPHPVLKEVKIKNNGIDIGTNRGATARVIFDGIVSGVVAIPGAQKAVIVRHGEYLTVYSNLSSVFVKMGEKIKTKQAIGTVYSDNENAKTELHLELWQGSKMLNPAEWIAR